MSRNSREKIFDVIVIGGGAAGMSAALWCDELGLKTLLLEENSAFGGQLWRVYNPIKNHLGGEAKNGRAMQKKFLKQINERKFERQTESKIINVNLAGKTITVENKAEFKWRFLIIATGVSRRGLGAQGEDEFRGRGLLESGKRDAKRVRNKRVAVVGGGDAALENALILATSAAEVTVIHRRKNFTARPEFIEQAKKNRRIKFITETVVKKFCGAAKLEFLELQNTRTEKLSTLQIDSALLRVGVEPNTKIFNGKIKLDDQGYIKVDANGETSVKNIFAVGDVASPLAPTISTAVGMGATAAKAIFKKLKP